MSFGASIKGGRLEYGLASVDAIFAQRKNALDPRFLRMLSDILHFNRNAEAVVTDPAMTIARTSAAAWAPGPWFRDHYITPFSGAIWSTPTTGILDFPAQALVRFFRNHALLGYEGQHQWYTVQGGSVEYVRRLSGRDDRRRGRYPHRRAHCRRPARSRAAVLVRAEGGEWEMFDDVIFATHSDQALRLLADPTPQERAPFPPSAISRTRPFCMPTPALMPRSRKVWSSWSYVEPKAGPGDRIDLTYWMNSLQPIPQDDPLFVTLNTTRPIRDGSDPRCHHLPPSGVRRGRLRRRRTRIRAMNGARNTWFCGAWMRNGFHEDGFASAVDVVEALAERHSMRLAA